MPRRLQYVHSSETGGVLIWIPSVAAPFWLTTGPGVPETLDCADIQRLLILPVFGLVRRKARSQGSVMSIYVGVDVGAVSVKAALLLPKPDAQRVLGSADGARLLRAVATPPAAEWAVLVANSRRARGRPLEVTRGLLVELTRHIPGERMTSLTLTGCGAGLVAEALGAATCNEFQACARAVDFLHPHVRTVFEIGGESSRYLRLGPDPASGVLGILDYSTNGDCAAGTGAFLDQQAKRLKYAVEDIGRVVDQAQRAAAIAGRCSVFAKSDMIHAQQKGFSPAEVLRGLCNTVATNFKAAVVRGRTPEPPVALLGGVSANSAVVRALREVFKLAEEQLFVPEAAESLPAVGAALAATSAAQARAPRSTQPEAAVPQSGLAEQIARLDAAANRDGHEFPRMPPLTLERVKLLRDRVRPYQFPTTGTPVEAYLGLDIGSVGTKLVLIDSRGEVIHSIFTRTEGRPIEVVARCLRELEEAVGWGVRVRAVGSTGSGRELIGELVGADSINDEITCHKTGATFIGDRLLGQRPDTIFEIGGQDSKFISLQSDVAQPPSAGAQAQPGAAVPPPDSIVVDFTMNEACAAGTGSFLEERAEELGVSIKGEFARLALSSRAPVKLGERCTVFMERDVNTYMQRGADRADVIAGLAYSIVHNYINRVVRGRRIGNCIFLQGGTAHNDAVAAAFSILCNKEIIVPPHNAVLGAIGAALLARDKLVATGARTRFRGWDMSKVDYTLREFTCRGCGNECSIQEFNVEGEKTFWGDKCSDRYRKRVKTDRKPVIPDLIALRHELLFADEGGDPPGATVTIGIPLAMYMWDLLPLWRRFFRDCGFKVHVSAETRRTTVRAGLDAVVAEPCFPLIVAHGHAAELIDAGVDYLWLPNLISMEERWRGLESYVCPWGQTLPFVIRQAPRFRGWPGRILCPLVSFQDGLPAVRRALVRLAGDLGVRARVAERALDAGLAAQQRFHEAYAAAGQQAFAKLAETGEPGMVLVGRPYNVHDAGVSLAVARKLRDQYGVNVLPVDALPLKDSDVSDVCDNMYWAYGRRILAAGKLVAQHPNLHIIYVTNFKCGPDSFLKGYLRPAANGKPFLALQFDGHSNDAGMMTRCEAYLDSKGILRWWRTCQSKPADQLLPAGPSTSPKCRTPLHG
jgi:activator of 2-hydroxyglutaryl-CoA dehydratase/predicted nucleotide-binding protein (sugar kinase/HSP70/actin superfamily)